ncbi:MAG: ECF transporter S component [Anaerolineae bacterium]|nr:ECF transporter S component [Anaerolineae bacterium]
MDLNSRRRKLFSILTYGLTSLIGLFAFLYPFLWPAMVAQDGMAHSADAPLTLTVLVALCFIALLIEVQGDEVSTKFIALLGILVAINSVLRFVEIAIPIPGGFSPLFFLIILTGYVYGSRFGFLMGTLTLLVSAFITGGIGPWMPYQMFTAGWVGLLAPLCRPLVKIVGGEDSRFEVSVLAFVGAVWGLLYGVIMNVWFWPFATGPADQYWELGITIRETLRRYALFYSVTSLTWDISRAFGNAALLFLFGAPTLRVLRRFKRRFAFTHDSTAIETSGILEPGLHRCIR